MSARSDTRLRWLLCLFLLVAVCGVYLPTAWFDFTNYDDPDYVTKNPPVRFGLTTAGVKWAFTHAHSGNWHPLTWLSHMTDQQVYGGWAGGHHVTNVMLHAANTVLVFLLLHALTGAMWRGFVVAALFALHPMHVESVAWIAERKDVLSSCFGLLSLWAYAAYTRAQPFPTSAVTNRFVLSKSARWYALALATFALGLMSKPMLVTLPVVLFIIDYWPLQRFHLERWRVLVTEKLPFIALAAASCLVTLWAQQQAIVPVSRDTLTHRAANVVVSYMLYLWKLFWPAKLAVLYPEVRSWPVVTIGAVVVGLSSLLGLALWQRRARPWITTGLAWFLTMLLPVIGLVKVGSHAIADRYTYLPSIGLFVAVVWIVADWLRPRISSAVAVIVIAGCAWTASRQVFHWQNTQTLFRHTIEVTENNYLAHTSLAFDYAEYKQTRQAEAELRKSVEINPLFEPGWSELAVVLLDELRIDEGIGACRRAVEIDPRSAGPHSTLGQAFIRLGRTNEAVVEYETALQLKPDLAEPHYNLANTLASLGRYAEAKEHYIAAAKADPFSADAHNNLGYMWAREGNLESAIAEFEQTIRLRPESWRAHYGLGDALMRKGQPQRAAQEFAETLKFRPQFSPARIQLGLCFTSAGELAAAENEFKQVLHEQPGSAMAELHLADVMQKQGRLSECIEHLRAAVRLAPNFVEASNRLAALERERRQQK